MEMLQAALCSLVAVRSTDLLESIHLLLFLYDVQDGPYFSFLMASTAVLIRLDGNPNLVLGAFLPLAV